jgi:hypothetical protein
MWFACLILAVLILRWSLRRRLAHHEEMTPFEAAPSVVVALDYIAEARETSGQRQAELCLFARLALDDARAAATTDAERAAIVLANQLLNGTARPSSRSLIVGRVD